MANDEIYHITKDVEYHLIDMQRRIILGTFSTQEAAEGFLINNPIYRKPEIKIIPTLTYRDMISLDYLVTCMSTIYNVNKKNWSDNNVLNKIMREFVEKIDDIRSTKSVKDYMR